MVASGLLVPPRAKCGAGVVAGADRDAADAGAAGRDVVVM